MSPRMIGCFLTSVWVFLAGSLGSVKVSAQPTSDRIASLFADAEDAVPAGFASEPDDTTTIVLQQRLVRLDRELLAMARQHLNAGRADAPPAVLRLNLFNDVVLDAVVERTGPTSAGYWLSGHIEGSAPGSMTLVVNGDVIAGEVSAPGATYEIRSVGNGVHAIRRIDPAALQCLEPDSPPAVNAFGDSKYQTGVSASRDEAPHAEDGSRIDVLVAYTPAARDAEGGRKQIEARIDLFVAETNQAYADSGVIQRINLVRTAEVDYIEAEHPEVECVECALRDQSDGLLDEVHEMRDRYAADLVALIVAEPYPYGGTATVMLDPASVDAPTLYAFSVTRQDAGGIVFAHELGHNMGLLHDRWDEVHRCCTARDGRSLATNTPLHYSYGYVNQQAFVAGAPVSTRWHTIMGIDSQCRDAGFACSRLLRFSNPDMTYNGDPMGVPGDGPSSSVNGPSDARRTLNETRRVVANFRVAQSIDETAKRSHVFPQIADGGGWQSVLLVTNTAPSESECTLQLHGLPLERFENAGQYQAPDSPSTARFSLPGPDGSLIWSTRNESVEVAAGYATLDCDAPVVAQVLYVARGESGAPTGMATVFSSQAGAAFQFPVMPEARLAFAIANDTDTDASCRVTHNGVSSEAFRVHSKSNAARFLDQVISIPGGFSRGSAAVTCDQQVSVIGLQADGPVFTTLPAAILSTTPTASPEFHGHWEGNLFTTKAIFPPAWRDFVEGSDCTNLVDCGSYTPLAADLTQHGQTVTGSVRTTFGEPPELEWAVHGVVSDNVTTLSLTSDDVASFTDPDSGEVVSFRLASWESRADTPGVMTGTATLHVSLDSLPGTLVRGGCLGDGTYIPVVPVVG